jgi:hypothetical protein
MRKVCLVAMAMVFGLAAVHCGGSDELVPEDFVKGGWSGKEDASVLATVLDFEWDGEVQTDYAWDKQQTIEDQLLYTIGHLNENTSVGRLDRLETSNIKSTTASGKTTITYHAKMPVAWGSKTNLPTEYKFTLPRDISSSGQTAFTDKYKHDCIDYGAHDVDSGSMWYYYRPRTSGCALAQTDVVDSVAKVTVSTVNTTGKYPEYHQVWKDGALQVVAIFGKYEDGATTSSDAGVSAYNEFVNAIKSKLQSYSLVTVPATVPTSPGVDAPEISFSATLPSDKKVEVTAFLVDNISSTTSEFDAKYNTLSTNADVIAYNGHAGLGQNVRALASKGSWVAGQYVIIFMNGCDTYAYVDGSLAETRASVNPDDPTGTKYMEFVINAMPAFFHSDSEASMAIINGLMKFETPSTYEQIFMSIDRSQIVLVTGEQDNVYTPGYDPENPVDPETWTGHESSGTLAKDQQARVETPALPIGSYKFQLTGSGDADLYVRVGKAPTESEWDCRPYRTSSRETCNLTLNASAKIYVMVSGYAASSNYKLVGSKR